MRFTVLCSTIFTAALDPPESEWDVVSCYSSHLSLITKVSEFLEM